MAELFVPPATVLAAPLATFPSPAKDEAFVATGGVVEPAADGTCATGGDRRWSKLASANLAQGVGRTKQLVVASLRLLALRRIDQGAIAHHAHEGEFDARVRSAARNCVTTRPALGAVDSNRECCG